jgi:hypothetical protein
LLIKNVGKEIIEDEGGTPNRGVENIEMNFS